MAGFEMFMKKDKMQDAKMAGKAVVKKKAKKKSVLKKSGKKK